MLDHFKDEVLSHYTDSYGFVTVDRDPTPNSTGNGFLHLAFFCSVLARIGQLEYARAYVETAIQESRVKKPNGFYRGLFHRNPWKKETELNSWDEYFGIAALSALFKLPYASDIVARGVAYDWYFDNQSPDDPKIESWHDRFIGLTAFYKVCAAYPMVVIEKLAVSLAVLVSCFSKKADVNMREFVRITILKDSGWVFSLVAKIWTWQAQKKFGTLGVMVKSYFGEWHPFSRLPWVN